MAHDPETADRIRKLLAGRSDISETRMMGGLSFMAGGAMICAVSGEGGLLVRVTPATREAALARPYAGPARIAGREMRGFVRVASEGHADEAEKSRAERKEDLILHGPSAGGVSQSDIDALFD